MDQEICWLSATELAEGIRNKTFSSQEVVQAHLDRIAALNPTLNAIVTFAPDPLALAKEADAAIARGDDLGPLHGVPFTLKDCVEVAGLRATQGSLILKDNISTQDSTVYSRLKGAGGILLGKTNLPEFALWWETNNLLFGATQNPWKLGYTPRWIERRRGRVAGYRNVTPGRRDRPRGAPYGSRPASAVWLA